MSIAPSGCQARFPGIPQKLRLIPAAKRDIRDSEAKFTSNFLVLYPEELKNPEITRYTKK